MQFYWVAEEILTPGVAKRDELTIPFYTLGADRADVIVSYAFADIPL